MGKKEERKVGMAWVIEKFLFCVIKNGNGTFGTQYGAFNGKLNGLFNGKLNGLFNGK